MKYAHLERYRVTLQTLSPVFIGASSQEYLSKKECAVDVRGGVLYVPDMPLLVGTIVRHGCLDDYEAYLQNNIAGQGTQNLYQFLQAMCIPITAREPWVKYVLRIGSKEITTINTLASFIKNASGLPYIPGSSIKGAIRTALLADLTSEEKLNEIIRDVQNDIQSKRIQKNRRAGSEEYALRILKMNSERNREKDAVNDLLRSLEVSDSAPFAGNSMVVCKKLEYDSDGNIRGNSDGNRRGKTAPPLFRECLMPGMRTQLYITIDTSVAGSALNINTIQKALNRWNTIQNEYLELFYPDEIKLDRTKCKGMPIILGGGVGFQSKSIIYAHPKKNTVRTEAERILSAQFQKYKPKYADDPAPYRMKIVTCDGRYYQMGRCDMIVEEV